MFILIIAILVVSFILLAFQRKHSPETLVNGWLDYEKAKELAPSIFTNEEHTVTEVVYEGNYRILCTFENKKGKRIDFKKILKTPSFSSLKQYDAFQAFHLNNDKKALVWESGPYLSYNLAYAFGKEIET